MTHDERFILKASDLRFGRAADDRVVLKIGDTMRAVGSVMAAFPLTDPYGMVALRDDNGDEIGILDDVRQLDPVSQKIIAEELERSYFMPKITDILDIEEELGVETWEVETDKGQRTFQVRNVRQNVRKLGRRRLVIKDVDGNRYEIRDWQGLPPVARRFLEEYI